MTSQSRLAAIRERLSRATPGEWSYTIRQDGSSYMSCGRPDTAPHEIGDCDLSEKNLALIAHAGGTDGDLAWCVAYIERLLGITEASEKLADACEPITDWLGNQLREPSTVTARNIEAALSAYDTAKGKDNG